MINRKTLLLVGLSYLLGAVPFSYLVARTRGVDLRTVGSGNLGSGNVWRACGFKPFLVTIVLDVLKGATVPLIARHRLRLPPLSVVLTGISAMLGHTFPVYMRFKGGKAAATGAGVLLAIFPVGMVLSLVAWFGAVFVTRITSVGTLLASAVALVSALIAAVQGRLERVYAFFIVLGVGLVVFLHRANIKRLREGTENRLEKLF